VAKGIAKGARRAVRDAAPFSDVLAEAIEAGRQELARTPELLPALKAAGVVDAGGYGLITFLKGCLEGLEGGYIGPEAGLDLALYIAENTPAAQPSLTHPYCTEFIVKDAVIGANGAKEQLQVMGDSLVIAEGDRLLKIHIHTAHPGLVLETALTWGALNGIKIDNMTEQHRPGLFEANTKSGISVISVVAGEGLEEIMRNLGAQIISGGQTMNPPVEHFIEAVHSGAAREYIILPNNKNIILSAGQAKKLLGKHVEVVPTSSVAQGLAALVAFDGEKSLTENIAVMSQRIQDLREGSITTAVRDSIVEDRTVQAGSYIGVVDGKVTVAAETLDESLLLLAQTLITPDSEIVTFYYGAEVTKEEADRLAAEVQEAYSHIETEVYYGGQPHYYFFVSVE